MTAVYATDYEEWELERWLERYVHVLDAVEDGEGFTRFTRHIFSSATQSVLYDSSATIRNDRPDDLREYYTEISLPNGLKGDFLTSGFMKAQNEIIILWNRLYRRFLDASDVLAEMLPDWDLDDGLAAATNEMTF